MSGARGDDHAVAPGHDAGRERQAVEEGRLLVITAVAVRVFEEPDHAARLALAVDAQRIIAHLDDPELAVGPPVDRDRVLDQRLAGDQLDLEPGAHRGSISSAACGDLRLRRHVFQADH